MFRIRKFFWEKIRAANALKNDLSQRVMVDHFFNVTGISIAGKDVTQAPPGSDCNVVLTAQKNIAYSKNDCLLIAQLNNPKQRLVASAEIA
ncbi:MAG: hypothetical protein Q8M95_09460 [Candidatus Methanoperedens sp.]|nr:hypothetical protein [Candidatus Methanoperedens sp.]